MRQIAVLGIGVLGYNIAYHLTKEGVDVIAVDKDRHRIDRVKEFILNAAVADITDEEALRKLGVDKVDLAVVAMGDNIEASILATAIVKKFGVKEVWARAISETQEQVLEILGVDHVINLEEEMGRQLAYSIATPNVDRFVEITENIDLVEVEPSERFVGKSLIEADFRNRYDMNVIAIRRYTKDEEGNEKEVVKELPRASDIIQKGDVLIVIGTSQGIENFRDANT
jgi:trk system potassium uptake protein TrkA